MSDNATMIEGVDVLTLLSVLIFQMKTLNDEFFPVVWTEDWKNWTLAEQLEFQKVIEVLYALACTWKEKFDATVWAGHANGTVDLAIKSIRQERTGDKPGRKAAPVTAESILAKRLKK